MRWVLYAGILSASAFFGYDRLSGPAFAVMPGSADALVTPLAPADGTVPLRIDLPVSWQLTRSKLMGPGAATMTESFRETWTLEVASSGRVFLASPRARVPAFTEDARPRGSATDLPQTVVISERDLAKLVGIKASSGADDEPEAPIDPVGRPVTLNLRQTRGGLDVSLAWSEEEHFAVHLDIGGTSVF